MKMNKMTATAILLAAAVMLGGCSSEPASDGSDEQVTTAAATTEPTTAEEPAESTTSSVTEPDTDAAEAGDVIKDIVTENRYQCENLGATIDELKSHYVNEPEYGTFAEPPRKSYSFGDGVVYGGDERIEIVTYADFTGEILPDLKLGMGFDEISRNYALSEPDTANLFGTYLTSTDVRLNGKEMTVSIDFGSDANCTAASYVMITEKLS